ncbi:hypothetical protein HPHPP8B_0962 [Helicobacter pylori Hp P-8b]|nr:hypothetical protein HPHPP8_1069 [Helicobacter pylori Hp P-8]EJC28402.1 hypothetical protein HPHPP8B_0962 [Helicobacter pylori Hp P-8b]
MVNCYFRDFANVFYRFILIISFYAFFCIVFSIISCFYARICVKGLKFLGSWVNSFKFSFNKTS